MRCSDFLRLYSDYRDGEITDPRLESDIGHHLTECGRCMDYDATIARGVMLLRATSDVPPSPGFTHRLERRLSQSNPKAEHIGSTRSVHAGIMVALMMAAAIAVVVGIGSDAAELGPQQEIVTATVPITPPVSNTRSGGGMVDLTGLSVPAFGTEVGSATRSQLSFTTWVSLSR